MKLVAIKDFANVKALDLDANELKLANANHIPKGLRFSIGKTEVFKELNESQKEVVSKLVASASVVVDCKDNADIVSRIDDEVKSSAKVDAAIAKKSATVA
jgi:hypothetical protein